MPSLAGRRVTRAITDLRFIRVDGTFDEHDFAALPLAANRDIVAAHEAAHVAAVANFDPLQPFHVGNAVPAGNDQPQRRAVALARCGCPLRS